MIASAASIGALQQRLDIIAGNIANINTVGYKRKTSVFEDLLTSLQPREEAFRLPGRATPPGFTQGWGARLIATMPDLTQGTLRSTGNPNDVAIEGNAMFVVGKDGTDVYTRNGAFQLVPLANGDRQLVTDGGLPIQDRNGNDIIVPAGRNLTISAEGFLTAVGNEGTAPIDLGQLQLVQVLKPDLLRAIGDNLYSVDAGANPAGIVQLLPAKPVDVAVRQGYTEQSNVSLADEMTELINVQRAYQLNARALASADQMLGMANSLRG